MRALPHPIPDNPLPLLVSWLDEARESTELPNPDAMTLATVTPEGQPAARAVLCKSIVSNPGYLVFYTNYLSSKCRDIAHEARVGAVFHWDRLGRQARIEGVAIASPPEESDAYFAARDHDSQIGAWASAQSQPLADRELLLQRVTELGVQYQGKAVPRPPHWGGYRIWVAAAELWLCGEARLHDRVRWERNLLRNARGNFDTGSWRSQRLHP